MSDLVKKPLESIDVMLQYLQEGDTCIYTSQYGYPPLEISPNMLHPCLVYRLRVLKQYKTRT